MPFGYLVTVVVIGWCTLLAVAPVRRPRRLGLISWRFALVVNELPFVAFYWLLAATLLAFGQGDLDSSGGRAVLGAAVLVAVGLTVVTWRGWRARRASGDALSAALGDGWRADVDPGLAAGLRRRLPWARILLDPFLMRRRDVQRIADIRYGDAGARNLLDVYRHRSGSSGGPTLVYMHGGGFVSGRKNREARPLLYRLASQGWVCVSANYRLSPAATFPDHLVDTKKVLAWVREHGRDYGADPATVFVAGSSAGAHLAAMAALSPNDPAFQPGFEQTDTSVTAAICLYGYYGRADGTHPTSTPNAYVGADAPPFFVAHGDQDTYVPVDGAQRFVGRLRSGSSAPVVFAQLPGGQHAFDLFHSVRFEAVVDAVEAFAAWVRSRADTPRDAGSRSQDVAPGGTGRPDTTREPRR